MVSLVDGNNRTLRKNIYLLVIGFVQEADIGINSFIFSYNSEKILVYILPRLAYLISNYPNVCISARNIYYAKRYCRCVKYSRIKNSARYKD